MGTIATDSIQLESIKDVTDAAEEAQEKSAYILPVIDATTGDTTDVILNIDKAATTADLENAYAKLTDSALEIYAPVTSGGTTTDTLVASYGVTAQVGQSGGGHTNITDAGMTVYGDDGTIELANIGFGPGTDASGSTTEAPYFSLGHRRTSSVVGNFSTSEGVDNIASGYASHAEGYYNGTSGLAAHTEGRYNSASGSDSHAEGFSTTASGASSHAQGAYTIAAKRAQTVIGTNNIEDTATTTTHPSGVADYGEHALIIGNGTGTQSGRSNALTVDWAGNVEAAGTITDGSGNSIFAGDYDLLLTQTLSSTTTGYDLDGSLDDYKFVLFKFRNGNNVDFRILPVSVFKLITSSATAGNLMDVYTQIGGTGRRVLLRYSGASRISASCSVNQGIALQVYGIK